MDIQFLKQKEKELNKIIKNIWRIKINFNKF